MLWQFEATHLLVGRLKPMAKTSLLKEFDIIASTLKIDYDKEKVTTSIDTDSFKLFCHSEPIRYHCLLPLTNPTKVSSIPGGLTASDKSLPIFTFSYKASPPRYPVGTTKRYTLQFLKDVSYGTLSTMQEKLVFRGGFPEDPCICSQLLHIINKEASSRLLTPTTGSFTPIFESRDLVARNPQNQRLFIEELFAVLRVPASSTTDWSNLIPTPTSPFLPLSFSGWNGLIAESVDKFEHLSTSDTNLMVPYCSYSLQCQPNETLQSALTSARNAGMDMFNIKLAYIERPHLQIPCQRSIQESLVLIYDKECSQPTANWTSQSQAPTQSDVRGMIYFRKLYALDARRSLSASTSSVSPTSSVTGEHSTRDRWILNALRKQGAIHIKRIKALEERVRKLEDQHHTANETPPFPDETADPTTTHSEEKKKKKKKKKKSKTEQDQVDSTTEQDTC